MNVYTVMTRLCLYKLTFIIRNQSGTKNLLYVKNSNQVTINISENECMELLLAMLS